jgi:hypothetical protein
MRESHSRRGKRIGGKRSKNLPKCLIELSLHSTSGEAGMFTILILTAIVVPALFIGHIASKLPRPQEAYRRRRAGQRR